jgi:hypothetical protein
MASKGTTADMLHFNKDTQQPHQQLLSDCTKYSQAFNPQSLTPRAIGSGCSTVLLTLPKTIQFAADPTAQLLYTLDLSLQTDAVAPHNDRLHSNRLAKINILSQTTHEVTTCTSCCCLLCWSPK